MEFLIESAWAQGAPAQQGSPYGGFIMLLVFFAAMYFLLIRPQAKRAKEHAAMVAALSKGDEVVTAGGVLGKISDMDDQFVKLKIAPNTEIRVQRNTIGTIMPKGTMKD